MDVSAEAAVCGFEGGPVVSTWRRGAEAGARAALILADGFPARVRVLQIFGTIIDTTAGAVAAAAAEAVWRALDIEPPPGSRETLERRVFRRARGRGAEDVPTLDELLGR